MKTSKEGSASAKFRKEVNFRTFAEGKKWSMTKDSEMMDSLAEMNVWEQLKKHTFRVAPIHVI